MSIAYDLLFTNPTASYIKSAAPLYVASGETFNSSDLTLKTYNSGDIVLDAGTSTSATGTVKFYDSNVKAATTMTPIGFAAAASDINTFRSNFTNETVIGSINEAYSAAVGGAGGLWLDGGSYAYPNTTYVTDLMVPSGNVGIGATSAGTAKLYVNGNVGIGTTGPSEKLHVVGGIQTSGASAGTNGSYGLMDYSSGMRFISNGIDATTRGTFTFYSRESDQGNQIIPLEIQNDGDVVLVQNSGNVGIGTTAPGAKLQVIGTRDTTYQSNVLSVMDDTAMATGVGGGMILEGKYTAAGGYAGGGAATSASGRRDRAGC
ncbi:MAG: hypothetical protein UY44_C0020G0002 [Candidatus Kaiserbacteria bacterium GW2011_GWA2_49_19]|uniref:Uncharacterized protein n=1 Tax=Candidatus Kaiserbacteria bacterium GW2011_GWA2_49_19 TaxID=1618669 RepID=A0A0G1VNE9_9BACT|nr:MAG: hypothetical protein UY44_C0020G0002 [Candidatus Kaiserbacteria bacterium GW2011_GWA2_49_19]